MWHKTWFLPLFLAGCAATSVSAPPSGMAVQPATLAGYHWVLASATDRNGTRIDALFARPEQPLQIDFSDGRVAVGNACNRIGGTYSIAAGKLRVENLASTLMACADPKLAALDSAISRQLRGNPTISLDTQVGAPRLILLAGNGDRTEFTGKPTAATRYGGPGAREFLEVAAQTVPCNHPLMPGKQCLRVREVHYDANGLKAGVPGEWQILGQDIEGYTHAPGVRNVLRVDRYTIAHPPADAPAQAYVLDMVVESEIVKPPR
ncbi:MAG: META and DUF4377 domain-containing protein [Proteobacteria bacterium]|nr:META and DUF4377 domain-containing protein [Pseudomonadota bacterium]